ncbi:unnamed protein product [Mucor hiemalis]
MGVRKHYWFLVQIAIFTYILGAGMYLLSDHGVIPPTLSTRSKNLWESLNSYKLKAQVDVPKYDPNFIKQPDSYTIDPPNLDFKMKVRLPRATNATERQAAAFIVLVRNSELHGMLQTMHDLERRFNHKFNYPYVFLNEEPFTEEFMEATRDTASSDVHYGLVDESMWGYPPWIDQEHAAREREAMEGIPYGTSESYRHMCRFQSGFFWRHPLVLSLNLEYYWRIEPDVRYYCDLDYDPFLYMKKNNKKYGKAAKQNIFNEIGETYFTIGFNIAFVEHGGTIHTLWKTVKDFARSSTMMGKNYFSHLYKDSIFRFISEDEGATYNSCHFWTNFEIARMDLWHTSAYQEFFEYLDRSGGFFYERWGDAPVHSIFAALHLRKDEVHFFNDIGYKHSIYEHCPAEDPLLRRCGCNPSDSLDFTDHMSCLSRYTSAQDFNPKDDKRTLNELLIS